MSLLVFDEVITGFRLGPTTYGVLCGVTPDLTCLGKIIGGGMPIGAVGGRAEVMDQLAPLGPVYQAGTLSGNPVAVAAGLSTLRILVEENPYPAIALLGEQLVEGILRQAVPKSAMPNCVRCGGVFTMFFRPQPPRNATEARQSDTQAYAHFFHQMLQRGIYLPPSQFEVCFISASHSPQDTQFLLNSTAMAHTA